MVVHFSNPSYLGGTGRRTMSSRPTRANLARLYLKNKIQMKGLKAWFKWEECLPSMPEALGSIPSNEKEKKKSRSRLLPFACYCEIQIT
jgi:hypothetical protein